MMLRGSDYALCRLAERSSGALKLFGDIETACLRKRLDEVSVARPVFITGLARSGTTILLNAFSSLERVATHRYRDFPFLLIPWSWNAYVERLARDEQPVERPHRDRIRITRDSPDAFEEPIWKHFFPFIHGPDGIRALNADDDDPRFDAFFTDHLRKILLLRGRSRYVSKGNYNVTRLGYIANLFPDARFVIPIRHPVDHVRSLLAQHQLFTAYSERDSRVPAYLRAAGHFEFGPQRLPVAIDRRAARRVADAWNEGNDALGYAICWRNIYAHAAAAADDAPFADRIRIVRYEDFCSAPSDVLADLLAFCRLDEDAETVLTRLPAISAPNVSGRAGGDAADVWRETADVAESFGYEREGIGASRRR